MKTVAAHAVRRGKSQEFLAKLLGVSPSTVQRAFNSKKPQKATVLRYCEKVGISARGARALAGAATPIDFAEASRNLKRMLILRFNASKTRIESFEQRFNALSQEKRERTLRDFIVKFEVDGGEDELRDIARRFGVLDGFAADPKIADRVADLVDAIAGLGPSRRRAASHARVFISWLAEQGEARDANALLNAFDDDFWVRLSSDGLSDEERAILFSSQGAN